MDNHEEKEDALNRKPDAEDTSPNEDIPLWLQGMEEPAPEETKPISTKEDAEAAWIREIDELSSMSATKEEHIFTVENDSDVNEFEIEIDPGVLEPTQPELKDEGFQESSLNDEDFDTFDDQESTEEIEIQVDSEKPIIDDMQPDMDTHSTVDGFVDISQADMAGETDETNNTLDDQPLREGDLPEWLQEMIAESEQDLIDNATEISEDPQFDDQFIDEEKNLDEDLFQQYEAESLEGIIESDHDIFDKTTTVEEDTAPIVLGTEEPEAALTDGEQPVEEDDVIIEDEELVDDVILVDDVDKFETFEPMQSDEHIPTADEDISDSGIKGTNISDGSDISLAEDVSESTGDSDVFTDEENTFEEAHAIYQIKQFIEDGQIEPALPLINGLDDDDIHLEDLEELLRQKAKTEPFANSEVLETLGDIALKRHKPQDAFDAYAKAISILLKSEGVRDEID